MGMGPIPWLAMRAWASYHELSDEAFELLVAVVRHVDAETLRRQAKKL
jgi:hypothetical protein